jgi:drug/metabolite transporter (DMT)-like permease
MSADVTTIHPAKPINLPLELTLLVILAAIWATSYTFIKIGVATIPPLTLIATRTLIAGLMLLAVMRMRGIAMPMGRAIWGRFLFQALMNSAVPFTLIAWAERTVDADLAVILNSTTPIFTFLLTVFITRHERVTLRTGFGVATGLAGVTLIVGVGALNGLGRDILGQLAIVLATVLYAGAAIYGRTFKGMPSMVPAAGSLLAGAAILMPLSLIVDRPWTLHPSEAGLWALLGLAVLSTAIPFVIYFRLMQTLGPVRATAQAFLRVPFGVLIGSLALGETLSVTSWIGFICVIIGVGVMTLGPADKPKAGIKLAN